MDKQKTLEPPATWRSWGIEMAIALPIAILAGASCTFMIFKLGFTALGTLGAVFAAINILISGPAGKHGANRIQTLVSTVGSMCAMCILIQVMHWMGMAMPPLWQLVGFIMLSGIFGIYVGMSNTPLLIDRWQLPYPSGQAVADVLQALSDPKLLKRSLVKILGAIVGGLAGGFAVFKEIPKVLAASHFSPATIGGGMIVGARIALPGLVLAVIGHFLTPTLRSIGWLGPNDAFRIVGFLFALQMILGASLVHIVPLVFETGKKLRGAGISGIDEGTRKLLTRTALWGAILTAYTAYIFSISVWYVLFAVALQLFFSLANGISSGKSDSNPISSAFVLTVFSLGLLGVVDLLTALILASIVFIGTSCAVDMQCARAAGKILGTDRDSQFRFDFIGVVLGALLLFPFGTVFFQGFPELLVPPTAGSQWESAMTVKIVGALSSLGQLKPYQIYVQLAGFAFGVIFELLRLWMRKRKDDQGNLCFSRNRKLDFVVDTILLPSPFAFSFGGFVSLYPTAWYAAGGVIASLYGSLSKKSDVPDEISPSKLIGGGLIAGESLIYIGIGLYVLSQQLL